MSNKKNSINPYDSSIIGQVNFLKDKEDFFYWLGQINKASLIINSQEGLLNKKYVKPFAQGLIKVLEEGSKGGPRPQNVIDFEPFWIKKSGAEVTQIHAGRSSQDMLTTCRMLKIRRNLLDLSNLLLEVIKTILTLAERHTLTIVPAYTNGVAAQPTSYGHYLQAFTQGLFRDQERIEFTLSHINRSPMGAMVLNGTSWPLNRQRMSDYLGFDKIAYNTYDATQIYSLEYPIEVASVITPIAIRIGNFIEDLMQQYAQPRPWILLHEGGKNTYVSSAMPQKRNPGILNSIRTLASTLIGESLGATIRSHNIPPGMADSRVEDTNKMVEHTCILLNNFHDALLALRINGERAKEELNLDWTASQEIADTLMRSHNIPFRIGHHIASDIVNFARKNNIKPLEFPYEQVKKIYKKIIENSNLKNLPSNLPLNEIEFKNTLNPDQIVANRAVQGGPQLKELNKMLKMSYEDYEKHQLWLVNIEKQIKRANTLLEEDFKRLL